VSKPAVFKRRGQKTGGASRKRALPVILPQRRRQTPRVVTATAVTRAL